MADTSGSGSGGTKKHGQRIKSAKIFRSSSGQAYERRRHERFLVTHQYFSMLLTAQAMKTQNTFQVEGWATDLSSSGVGACVDTYLPRDTVVGLELLGEFGPGLLKARVAWCNKLPTTGRILKKKYYRWRMGLEFLFKTDDEKTLISKIIDRM